MPEQNFCERWKMKALERWNRYGVNVELIQGLGDGNQVCVE